MRNKQLVCASILILVTIVIPLSLNILKGLDRNVKFVAVFCKQGSPKYFSFDSVTNELEGVFFADSSEVATSVKSEIIDDHQKSLGTYEWTLFKQDGTAALPKFTFKVPKDIHAKRLNFSITAK